MELLPSIARNKQIHIVLFTEAAGLEWFATLCHPPDAVLSEAGLLPHDAAVVQRKFPPRDALEDIRHGNICSAKHQMYKTDDM